MVMVWCQKHAEHYITFYKEENSGADKESILYTSYTRNNNVTYA